MALTAAQLEAILTLDKSQFDRGMSQVEQTTQKAGQGLREWGTGVGKAVNDGVVLAATGAAGFAAAVTSVGVEYNALQQSSRAALDTILGGMDKANEQMDKLNEFASNSPFARDVFIRAQQQLLGFGMEAEKVVPTLEAIQDAVAATGGSNEDIAGLADVLAKVEGTGKITAQTLNQLGYRGVDAATIIGEQMGKTGNQIREDITDGALDAGKAMDALTKGMTERFGGAAANVKETWLGATDRIKAATRDIGAEIARPFVDPMGGGRAIDWANDFADVLRAVERQVPSLVTVLDDRLSPSFHRFRISMKDAVDEIDSWDASDLEGILDRLGQHTPAIAGLSAAMFTMATSNIPVIGGLTSALGPLPAALGAAALASPEMRDGLKDLYEAGEPLIGVLGDLAGVASGTFTTALEGTGTILGGVADIIGPVVKWFADLPEPIRNAATAALIFNAAGRPMAGHLSNMGGGIQNLLTQFGGWAGTFRGAGDTLGDFQAAVSLVAGDVGRTARAGLRGALNGVMGLFGGPWGLALMGATAAITLWAQEQAAAKERAEELRASLDEQTGAFTENSDEIILNTLQQETWASNNASLIETAEELGLSIADLVGYIKGEEDATKRVTAALANWDELSDDITAKTDPRVDAQAKYKEAIDGVKQETAEAVEEEKESIRVRQELEDATDDSRRTQEQFAEAVAIAADETNTMEQRVRGLNDALDVLNGVEKSAEQAARDLFDSQQTLGEFISGVAEESNGLASGLWNVDEGMATISEEGNRFSEMLVRHEGDMKAAALAAYDKAGGDQNAAEAAAAASAEYDKQVEALEKLLLQSGMSKEEVDALIDSMERTPEEIAFVVTSNGTISDTDRALLDLAATIRATPGKEVNITDTTPEVRQRLEDMGFEIRNLDNGEVVVVTKGTQDAAQKIRDDVVNQDYTATVKVNVENPRSVLQSMVGEQQRSHPFIERPRYYGGIDIMGMALGGLTGASVMDFAQMVAPGDIRFAGDRSDVDEAWIPLDGSARSIAILEEAMARMPGYNPLGMAAGGITGNLTPPSVEEVGGPDTSELEQVWQDTMAVLEESTRATFATIEQDTAASQDATTKTTGDQFAQMQAITTQQLALMVAATAANMQAMDADATRYSASMRDATGQNLATMQTDTDARTASMRDTTAARFQAMQQDGSYQADVMRYNVSRQFLDMHTYGTGQAAGLRSDADREFTAMQTHGVTAASDLRAGIVAEIGAARTPFAGNVNDLVDVMRSFSDALNKAYGDMGVDVGKPSRISAATGAILPGWNPGVDNHIFSSPTGGILELSGGEGIGRPEVVQAFGAGNFMALNHAARTGGVRGVQQALANMVPRQAFADGGIMDGFTDDAKTIGTEYKNLLPDNWLRPAGRSIIDQVVDGMGDMLATLFSGDGWVRPTEGRVTSPYGAGRGAYPHAGMDIAKGEGVPVVAPTAMRILETGWNIGPGRTGLGILGELMGGMYSYFGHNPVGGVRVKPGDLVAPGQQIGAQGNTGNSTGAHLHWEIHQGAPWRDINPHPFWDAAGGGPGAGGVLPTGSNDMWTGIIAQALGLVGLPRTPAYVNAWLRQGKSESGLNPRAVQGIRDINSITGNHARGIVQVIPPTFAAYSLPGMKDIYNPLHNFAAGMNYAKNRYGAAGMLNVIGKGRGYEHGTESAVPGWAWVGEAGPELVKFRGGEQVMSNRESRAAVGGPVELSERSLDKLATKMADEIHRRPQVVIDGPSVTSEAKMAREVASAFRKENMRLARI